MKKIFFAIITIIFSISFFAKESCAFIAPQEKGITPPGFETTHNYPQINSDPNMQTVPQNDFQNQALEEETEENRNDKNILPDYGTSNPWIVISFAMAAIVLSYFLLKIFKVL